MNTIADLHTHTLASQHAYSTLGELCSAAKEKGFFAFAVTDHGPGMPDGAIAHHFFCLSGLPDEIDGMLLYKGAETNIMNYNGGLDLDATLLNQLDFVIASYHIECITPGTVQQHTQGLLYAIENPAVDCVGHCGNPVFAIDPLPIVKACAKHKKLIEINSASFKVRPGSEFTCKKIAQLCAQYHVKIVINSDAHSKWQVGEHSAALNMLAEIHFPENLIINSTKERLLSYFSNRQ